ncbi:MAG: group III truncated hemoglobin [Alphaproteobacteria bacterium]
MVKTDTITESTIKMLVDRFYEKVRRDKTLGPVFDAVIGHGDAAWIPHLEKMYCFWSAVMLTSGRYHGNPLQKHKDMPPFNEALFDTWLALFEETVHEIHTGAAALDYIEKSQRIAKSLKLALYYDPRKATA